MYAYLYFILQGNVCGCDISAVDCSVVRVESDKTIFCGFCYSESHSR